MFHNQHMDHLATSCVVTPLWRSVRMTLTLSKCGLGSPPGLPKTQSSIVGVKIPHLEVLFISLEKSWSVDVKMALHEPFEHLQHKLWTKEGWRVKLTIWLPTIKSQESTRPRCVQVECDTLLERSWGELQVYFRLHFNWRSKQGVMNSQSPGSLSRDSFWRTPKSLVKPTWRFNFVELRKVGTWGTLPTSSTRKG
jgi:hypothetical protein